MAQEKAEIMDSNLKTKYKSMLADVISLLIIFFLKSSFHNYPRQLFAQYAYLYFNKLQVNSKKEQCLIMIHAFDYNLPRKEK